MAPHTAMSNANFPMTAAGETYHVGVKAGEVANRILTVGDPARAILLASYLDGGHVIDPANHERFLNYRSPALWIKTSPRLFTTVTGKYKGVPVSIIAIGMGVPMLDFMIREVRAVIKGPMVVIRFGSCGSLGRARAGDLVVANESMICARNYDFFLDHPDAEPTPEEFEALMKQGEGPYIVSKACPADPKLTKELAASLAAHVPEKVQIHQGADITADSFYGSQARQDISFHDANQHFFSYLTKTYPDCECLQMETGGLFHLAKSARPLPDGVPSIRAAACAMVFAHRTQNTWIDPDMINVLQETCSRAILNVLINADIPKELAHPDEGAVWSA